MDVINKLYSSVSQTVSQLSAVLPGNLVTREYDVNTQIASAGRACMWQIYSGYKRSTKQEVSVFVLEKKQFDRFSKDDREQIFEIVKRGIQQLTKIRHPQVLTVEHPLEESRESFAFATEPVYASLANILGDTANLPPNVIKDLETFELYDIEIKYGMLQLFEGIQFLHNDAKLIHRNISPQSIVLNSSGIWKIFGFDFSVSNDQKHRYDFNPNQHILTIPSLEYSAPECALDNSYTARLDHFSIGVLICAIYSKKCYPFKTIDRNYTTFKSFSSDLRAKKRLNFMNVPNEIQATVEKLLTSLPDMRPDFPQLMKVPFFDDVGVKSLGYLDSLFQRDNQEKAKFYKGLPQIIERLPLRINLLRVLPCLIKEFVHHTMIPFVLPNVLLIAEKCTQAEYEKYIFVHLKPILSLRDPVQILLIFMQNMELLLKLTPPNDVKLYVLPMVYKALESNSKQIQELCLAVLPSFASLVDYPSMKNALLPRIKNLCILCNITSLRVNCLLCIGQLLPHLDKWLVLDDVLVFLPTIPTREPAVIMAIIGIYRISLNHELLGIPKEFVVNKVLPFLWPLSIENGLTLQQYKSIMQLIKELEHKVEQEHLKKLEQLSTDDTASPIDIIAPSKIEMDYKAELLHGKQRNNDLSSMQIDLKPLQVSNKPPVAVNSSIQPQLFMSVKPQTALMPVNVCAVASKPTQNPMVLTASSNQFAFNNVMNNNLSGNSMSFNSISPQSTNYSHAFSSYSDSASLLKPISTSTFKPNTAQSSTILSKEDIMEFLK
ncbi:SCY1-like protein 2 [Uranotaenia lowii]|uniref:SCY1-like protein 2 n=1 Tax=Uranotaenia lowii TaxID=190385 RepID=UPI0024791EF0|nr:SCY1-like protein 2 [Uranotaenia lowii]